MGGEGGGVGLVHDQPGEGTIEYWTRSCPFHKGLGKGVGNEKKIYRIRGLLKNFNRMTIIAYYNTVRPSA